MTDDWLDRWVPMLCIVLMLPGLVQQARHAINRPVLALPALPSRPAEVTFLARPVVRCLASEGCYQWQDTFPHVVSGASERWRN